MKATLKKQGFFSGSPAHIPPVVVGERVLVPDGLLSGDEIVLLAVKPSLWFIVLRSSPWLAGCALAVAVAWYLSYNRVEVEYSRLALQVAIAVALVRVSIAMFQWASRLYVLTNRRVMCVKGVLRVDVFESPLSKIQSTCLTVGPVGQLLRVGTIQINTLAGAGHGARWEHIAQPVTVHTRLRNSIGRSRMNGGGT